MLIMFEVGFEACGACEVKLMCELKVDIDFKENGVVEQRASSGR